jgi:hypothetical protein
MITKIINLYTFLELDDKAKEKAKNDFYEKEPVMLYEDMKT